MIREATQRKTNVFRMKCIPISNIIRLQHYCRVPSPSFFIRSWVGGKEMEGEINHLLQHKAQVISWKWTYTGVWYMGSLLPCNGNLSVLYDFIQNPSPSRGATKHIKAKWRMVPVSVSKADGGYNMYSPPTGVGDGRLPINYSVRNLPHCILFRSTGWTLPWLHACVSVWWLKCPTVACQCCTKRSWL